MNVFEKIRDKLEEYHEHCVNAYGIVGGNPHAFATKQCIEIVNQVEQEHNNGWILCSERLPEEGQRCIVQYNGSPFINKGFYIDIDTFMDGEFSFYKGSGVVAWQNLPQPYKERDTDE